MPLRLDPNVPPYKTKPFWYIAALGLLVSVGYPLTVRSDEPLWLQVLPSLATFAVVLSVAWFGIRRVQRGESYFTPRRIAWRLVLVAIGIILLVLANIFKQH